MLSERLAVLRAERPEYNDAFRFLAVINQKSATMATLISIITAAVLVFASLIETRYVFQDVIFAIFIVLQGISFVVLSIVNWIFDTRSLVLKGMTDDQICARVSRLVENRKTIINLLIVQNLISYFLAAAYVIPSI